MYINSITLENVRTFAAEKTIHFNHPDRAYGDDSPISCKPKLKNVNVLFGPNACGKSTVLEAIALASFGQAIIESRIDPRPLVRFLPTTRSPSLREGQKRATIQASLTLHGYEVTPPLPAGENKVASAKLTIESLDELERFHPESSGDVAWGSVYSSENHFFFIAAYGATRRVEPQYEKVHPKERRSRFLRLSRIESIIKEGYPLVSLQTWLPEYKRSTRRFNHVVELVNKSLGTGHFEFKGKEKAGDYCFTQGGIDIPFRSLSDGYRAFLGWVTDLLFHLDFASQRWRRNLDEIPGIVLVDEVDLHLHPKWQMEVIGNLSRAFPMLQFIFTSHSPLIAGSVEWMNITRLHLDSQHRTGVDPFVRPIHGLDADQILLSDLFGLKTTRAGSKNRRINELTRLARAGDEDAAKQLIAELARGTEAPE